MSEYKCPKCGASHDGKMDNNGWATCKECVHLWNLKKEIDQQAKAPEATVEKQSPEGSTEPNKREMSGYFPDESKPARTAALTKKEKQFSESELGRLPSEIAEVPDELPANSTMLKVEEEAAPVPVEVPEPSKETGGTVQNKSQSSNEFPDMATRITDNNDGNISCPVCGASFEGDESAGEINCPHCDTTFNVNTGRYKVSSSKPGEDDDKREEYEERTYTGEVVGGCKIGKKLGEGGMGSVYHAKQLSLDRDVALKLLPPDLTSQANFMKRFQQEARSLARINHNNIIGIYEFGEDKEQKIHYMMMEYVAGEDLAELLRRRHHLTEAETIDILKQSSLGLEQAALKGIIHRDIKPDNIMITKDGTCKVSDFGLAKNVASDSTMTNASIRVGTPAFMSPEQCDGLRLDFRSDIYSLGVTAFVMLTGHLPFNGESPFAIMLKHKTEAAPSLIDSIPHINPEVDKLVRRMMEKQPEARYSSWRVLREELDRVSEVLNGKTMAFDNAGAEPPSPDLKTEVTNLNADADPVEDISSMLNSLGQLERGSGDHPELRGGGSGGLDESGALPTVGDPLGDLNTEPAAGSAPAKADESAIPESVDMPPAVPQSNLDLTLQEPAPAMPSTPPPAVPGSGSFPSPLPPAAPGSGTHQSPLPPAAPGSGAFPSPLPSQQEAVSSGSQPLAAQGADKHGGPSSRSSGSLSAVSDSSKRSRTSSPLSAQGGTDKHDSTVRRNKDASGIRKRMEEAKTEQQQRVTQIRNRGEQYFGKGKYKKAISVFQKASQATTDVAIREECFQRIQVARMLMKQRLKRRAILSAVLLVPILIAAVFFCTPFVHNYYLAHNLDQIDDLQSEEMQRHRVERIAHYGQPFEWYTLVFFGMDYEIKDKKRLDVYLQKFKNAQKSNPNNEATQNVKRVDLSGLREMRLDNARSWSEVAHVANTLSAQAQSEKDKKEIAEIAAEAAQHLKIAADMGEQIKERLRQGRFEEAEQMGKEMAVREPRAGELLASLPKAVEVKVTDDAGQMIKDAVLIVNGLRQRQSELAYSLGNKPVSIEVRHTNYDSFTGEIDPGFSGTFKVELQPVALWTCETGIKDASWLRMSSWGHQRLVLCTSEALMAIDLNLGKRLDAYGRGDVNIAPGQGARSWTDSMQVLRDQILIGSGDGLLLSLGLGEDNNFKLIRTLFRGNHAVLNTISYDLLFRNGLGHAILVRQGGTSISMVGLVNGKEEWRQPGMLGSSTPFLFFRDAHIFVVDDMRFRKFEEDGTKKDSIQLANQRLGDCVWADDETLAIPHARGIDLISFAEDTYRVRAAVTSNAKIVGGIVRHGKYIYAAFDDGSLRAFTMRSGTLHEVWNYMMDEERKPMTGVSVANNVLCVSDQKGRVYCIHARTGDVVRTINLSAPLLSRPLHTGKYIICLDKRGIISAYQAPRTE